MNLDLNDLEGKIGTKGRTTRGLHVAQGAFGHVFPPTLRRRSNGATRSNHAHRQELHLEPHGAHQDLELRPGGGETNGGKE